MCSPVCECVLGVWVKLDVAYTIPDVLVCVNPFWRSGRRFFSKPLERTNQSTNNNDWGKDKSKNHPQQKSQGDPTNDSCK